MSEEIPADLVLAEHLRSKRQYDDALLVCNNFLNDHIDHWGALSLASHILIDTNRLGMANALLRRAVEVKPDSAVLWSNLGLTYQEGSDYKTGESCFIKALSRNPNDAAALNNLAQLYVNTAQPEKALNCAEKAIRLDPSMPDAQYNRGLALLQMGRWKEGWQGYDANLGAHRKRKERVYGRTPRWTGVKDLTLIAYGEQGIGDEISFASCLPDLIKENNVIVECDKRLEGLFRRSFDCPVYGTRFESGIAWPSKYAVDCSVAFGSLPRFYRNDDKDFPGTPYLKADPQRRIQWRALLDSLGSKPKIGIAWTGGLQNTGKERRSVAFGDLAPILRQDATFVSLQYMGAPEIQGCDFDIHHWPHALETQDYDNTAALVAELDLVITVTQAAVHLAGALGVPCWVLTPKAPMWRYGLKGDRMPWYSSVKLYRQKADWLHTISDVATDLRRFVNEAR